MDNKQYANGLRVIADFYEENDTFPQLYESCFNIYVSGLDELSKFVALLPKPVEKIFDDTFVSVYANFGGLKLRLIDYRETVCTKKVVGKKKVLKKVPTTTYQEMEIEEEIIEWDCGSILKERTVENET